MTLRRYVEQTYLPALTSEATSMKAAESRFRVRILPALRQGEAFGLAVDDVDFLRRVVHVRRQVRILGSKMTFAPPKGGKERDIPLPESVALRLSAHVAAYPPVPVELPWKTPDGKPVTVRLLFTDPGGSALHRSSFNATAWQPALRGAGLPCSRGNGMHALRHYFASACLASGWIYAPCPSTWATTTPVSRCGPTST